MIGTNLPHRVIGASIARKEDPRLLRGQGRFGADFARPGQLWARVVRSPVAHGRLRAVRTGRAARADGVVAVVTAASLPAGLAIPVRLQVQDADLRPYLQPVLATGTVRYVGEPVAVVVAGDPYAAEDAAELVDADIDEAPAVLDAAAAAAPGAPALFPGGNVAADFTLGFGDVTGAFARADHVVEIEVEIGRHGAVPLEPRALLADVDPATGALSIFGMTKVPVFNRDLLGSLLGMDETQIHVHAVDAGGGFGARGEFYPEDFLIPWLARTLRRPVMWVEDRAEHLVAVNHSRQQAHRIAGAFDADGRILGLRDDIVHDNGAYCRTHGIIVPELTVTMLPGPYRLPAYRGRIQVVLTSKTPCGTYRAPGRFEGSAAREQLLDVAAGELKISRNEIRSRNLLHPRELPCQRSMSTLGTDVVLDAGDYPALLAAAQAEADRLGYPSEVERGRRAGRRRGLGVAAFLEKSGLGPQETADVMVSRTGTVHVYSGGTSLGQGIETVLAQIAADALGVHPDQVSVVNGDTERQPFGGGSWASRSTVVAGSAVHAAAGAVRDRAAEVAARMLEAAPGDLVSENGRISVRGDPGAAVTLAEVAQATGPASPYLQPGEAGRAVRAAPVRGDAHDLPVRGAHRRGGRGPGHRRGPGPPLPGRLRGRAGYQPGAGGRPAARRRGPGHRRRAARRVLLRRERAAAVGHLHGLPDADRGRGAADRRADHPGFTGPGQPAGGARGGRGRGLRRRRRAGQRGAGRAGPGGQCRAAAAHPGPGAGTRH